MTKSLSPSVLAAKQAINEAMVAIEMMNQGWFHGTANLDNVDPLCAPLDYLGNHGRDMVVDCVMSNNFAFGGINTSLLFSRHRED